jgi:hypothetical protein
MPHIRRFADIHGSGKARQLGECLWHLHKTANEFNWHTILGECCPGSIASACTIAYCDIDIAV